MTYTELVERLRNTQATDAGDADFTAILPAMLEWAELRVARELAPVALLRTQEAALAGPGTGRIALPVDFVAPRALLRRSGTVRAPLLRRDDRFLAAYWPDSAVLGVPKYWAEAAGAEIAVAPPPAAGHTLELEYVHRPAGLSPTVPQTWLSQWTPDLLFAACCVFLAGWTRNYGAGDDPRMSGHWEGEYQKALAAARAEEAQRRGISDAPPAAGATQATG